MKLKSTPPLPLSRRAVLRGFAGLGIFLPALELTSGKAWGQAAPLRAQHFIVFFEHGGTVTRSDWDGNGFGSGDTNNNREGWSPLVASGSPLVNNLNDVHQPCKGLESHMLVLDGIDNLTCKATSAYNGGHEWTNKTVLTNRVLKDSKGETAGTATGPSIDAVISQRLQSQKTMRFQQINLSVSGHQYGTPFFTGPDAPMEGEENPNNAFKRLFAGVTPGSSPDASVLRARALKKSVLDGTSEGLALFRKTASKRDYDAIDAHLTSVRAIETQLDQIPVPSVGCSLPTVPSFAGQDLTYFPDVPHVGPVQVDIMVHAFACGLTHVGTLNIADFYNTWYGPDPYPAGFNIGHSLDHSGNDVGPKGPDRANFDQWYRTIVDNRQLRASLFARLLNGLQAVTEANGKTALENSVVLWTSEFRFGGVHGCSNLPVVLAGNAGGQLKTNRYLDFSTRSSAGYYQTTASLSNLYTSCLNLFGFSDTTFGETSIATVKASYPVPPTHIVSRFTSGPLPGLTL